MSKKTQKTKMSLAELAAMRGVEKPVQAGCTFDAELVPRDYESEKAEAAKKAAEVRHELFKKVSASVNFDVCFTNIEGVEGGWFIFACREDVPFFFCPKTPEGDYLVPDLEGVTFNAYKYADEFFTSEEVSLLPLDEAVELWKATGHYSRHPVMNCYKEGRGRTVIQALNGYYPDSEPASDWHWNDRGA